MTDNQTVFNNYYFEINLSYSECEPIQNQVIVLSCFSPSALSMYIACGITVKIFIYGKRHWRWQYHGEQSGGKCQKHG